MRAEAPGGIAALPAEGQLLRGRDPGPVHDSADARSRWHPGPARRRSSPRGSGYLFRGSGVSAGGRVPEGTVTLAAGMWRPSRGVSRPPLPVRRWTGAGGVSEAPKCAGGFGGDSDGGRSLRQSQTADPAWHWRQPGLRGPRVGGATGESPAHRPAAAEAAPVPLGGEMPGTRRGDRAGDRWATVIAAGSRSRRAPTPHLMARHSVRTLMEEKRIPHVMSERHLRHHIPGVSGAYRHVSDAMREELTAMMTAEHERALDARLGLSPRSPRRRPGRDAPRPGGRKTAPVSPGIPQKPGLTCSFPVDTHSTCDGTAVRDIPTPFASTRGSPSRSRYSPTASTLVRVVALSGRDSVDLPACRRPKPPAIVGPCGTPRPASSPTSPPPAP